MFADPQSVTYNAVAKSLAATGRSDNSSTYALNDSGVKYTLVVAHQDKPTRTRAVASFQRDAYASDPLVPAQNVLASAKVSLVFDFPKTGYTATDIQLIAKALRDWAVDANLLKIINGET